MQHFIHISHTVPVTESWATSKHMSADWVMYLWIFYSLTWTIQLGKWSGHGRTSLTGSAGPVCAALMLLPQIVFRSCSCSSWALLRGVVPLLFALCGAHWLVSLSTLARYVRAWLEIFIFISGSASFSLCCADEQKERNTCCPQIEYFEQFLAWGSAFAVCVMRSSHLSVWALWQGRSGLIGNFYFHCYQVRPHFLCAALMSSKRTKQHAVRRLYFVALGSWALLRGVVPLLFALCDWLVSLSTLAR